MILIYYIITHILYINSLCVVYKIFLYFRHTYKSSPPNSRYSKERHIDDNKNSSFPRKDQVNQSRESDNCISLAYNQRFRWPIYDVSTDNFYI